MMQISLNFHLIYFFIIVVIALAANKSDLYEEEEISEKQGKDYANEIGAIFKSTSALTGVGILELFNIIGKRLYNPFYIDNEENENENVKDDEFRDFVLFFIFFAQFLSINS